MDRFRVRAKMKRLRKWAKDYCKEVDDIERAKVLARKNAFKDFAGFMNALRGKGFEQLGSGYYSNVFAYPDSDKVVKILRRPDTDGWLDYVKWAADKGYAGTFAPQVFSYKLMGKKKDFAVAVMERLEDTVSKAGEQHDAHAITALLHPAMNDNKMAAKLLDTVNPGLAQFGKDLKVEFSKNLDTHNGNFMLRKDGSFVITDPVAGFPSKVSKLRLRRKDFTSAMAA